MRMAALLLFLSAYLVTLLLSPFYDAEALSLGLRLLFAACGLSLFVSFLVFTLSFRPSVPRALTPQGDDHAE